MNWYVQMFTLFYILLPKKYNWWMFSIYFSFACSCRTHEKRMQLLPELKCCKQSHGFSMTTRGICYYKFTAFTLSKHLKPVFCTTMNVSHLQWCLNTGCSTGFNNPNAIISYDSTGINKKDSDYLLFKAQFPQCQAMKKWIEMLNRYDDCKTYFTAVA